MADTTAGTNFRERIPAYQSHKKVWALRIKGIVYDAEEGGDDDDSDEGGDDDDEDQAEEAAENKEPAIRIPAPGSGPGAAPVAPGPRIRINPID